MAILRNDPFTLEHIGDRYEVEYELAGKTVATLLVQKGPDRGQLVVTVTTPNGSAAPLLTTVDCYNAAPLETTAVISVGTNASSLPQPRRILFEVSPTKNA